MLFCQNRHLARQIRDKATIFLAKELKLTINPKNDVIIRASDGLHWLGHIVTEASTEVDKNTTKRALDRVNTTNMASYKSLKLSKWPKRQLDWQVLDEIKDILT